MVAHELRTPLTALQGFTELLLSRTVPPERAARFLGHLHGEAQRLSRIVGELLDLSRIEAGRPLELRCEIGRLARGDRAQRRAVRRPSTTAIAFRCVAASGRADAPCRPGRRGPDSQEPDLQRGEVLARRRAGHRCREAGRRSSGDGRGLGGGRWRRDPGAMTSRASSKSTSGCPIGRRPPSEASDWGWRWSERWRKPTEGHVEVESKPGKGSKFRVFLPGESPVLADFPDSSA